MLKHYKTDIFILRTPNDFGNQHHVYHYVVKWQHLFHTFTNISKRGRFYSTNADDNTQNTKKGPKQNIFPLENLFINAIIIFKRQKICEILFLTLKNLVSNKRSYIPKQTCS